MDKDPLEMDNLFTTARGAALAAKEMPLGVFLSTCKGASECVSPQPAMVPKKALECHNTTKGLLAPGERYWD